MLDTRSIVDMFINANEIGGTLSECDSIEFFSGYSKDEVAQCIMNDHLFTFFVLKHANSISPRQVTSISSVVHKHGFSFISNIYCSYLLNSKRSAFSMSTFDTFNYRKKSLFKAIIATKITHEIDRFNKSKPESAFLIGLLSSIGNLPIMSFNDTKHYSNHHYNNTFPWLVQHDITGYNQFDVSYQLLNSSLFPNELLIPIRYVLQHETIDTNPYIKGLYAACLMSIAFAYPDKFSIKSILQNKFFLSLGLSQDWLLSLYKQAIDTTSERLLSNIVSLGRIVGR